MSCLRSFENIQVTEEIWSPEIENVLFEALKIYPLQKKKIMLNNGRIYGRNHLISLYIEKKTGKMRTQKQISSHIQVLLKRKNSGLNEFLKPVSPASIHSSSSSGLNSPETWPSPDSYGIIPLIRQPTPDRLIIPKCLQKYGLCFNNFNRISLNQPIRLNTDQILDDLQNGLPLRTIASPKLAFLAFFSYLTIPFGRIQHLYDSTLLLLLQKTPIDSFYVLKRWFDLRIPLEAYAENLYQNMCSSIFYSDKKLDIEVNTIAYTFGKPVYNSVVKNFPYIEVSTGSQTYYVYHTTHSCALFDRNLILKMAELKANSGTDVVSHALRNYAILVYFKDVHTQEILLVFIQTFDCSENEAMYKFQRLTL